MGIEKENFYTPAVTPTRRSVPNIVFTTPPPMSRRQQIVKDNYYDRNMSTTPKFFRRDSSTDLKPRIIEIPSTKINAVGCHPFMKMSPNKKVFRKILHQRA